MEGFGQEDCSSSATSAAAGTTTNSGHSEQMMQKASESEPPSALSVHQRGRKRTLVMVDVIVPVHNAEDTIVEAVESAMHQELCSSNETLSFEQYPKESLYSDDGEDERSSDKNNHKGVKKQNKTSIHIDVAICCYDDGSTDQSWTLLKKLDEQFASGAASDRDDMHENNHDNNSIARTKMQLWNSSMACMSTRLIIAKSSDGTSRGAGYARNRAAELRAKHTNKSGVDTNTHSSDGNVGEVQGGDCHFLCMLDSDDIMDKHRISEQLTYLLKLPTGERRRTLLGCQFRRDPPESTWHYTKWANSLSDDRLSLERYREVTVLQPTWMLSRTRFWELGGYVEAGQLPKTAADTTTSGDCLYSSNIADNDLMCEDRISRDDSGETLRLVHPQFDTFQTLRLAEDLRFFHAHLMKDGLIKLLRKQLVTYRHRAGMSQSSSTPRKLLLQLRVMAFEKTVLRKWTTKFVVWGAGRDGKEFFKSLSQAARDRVACFVDVDTKKIGYYFNKDLKVKVPVVHFSLLVRDPVRRLQLINEWEQGSKNVNEQKGRINKGKCEKGSDKNLNLLRSGEDRPSKKRKVYEFGKQEHLSLSTLPTLPVVVCVAMYRTNGVLESNVASCGRTEGRDIWHFS